MDKSLIVLALSVIPYLFLLFFIAQIIDRVVKRKKRTNKKKEDTK